jgi:hypothetical protein
MPAAIRNLPQDRRQLRLCADNDAWLISNRASLR